MGVKLSYDKHFASKREDGRHLSTYAAYMDRFRDMKRTLALPEDLTVESFSAWQTALVEKHRSLLCMPEVTAEPAPKLLSREKRDGYRLEKWEFYPDKYTVVPFLALIPDGASAEAPVPAVMCVPGTNHSKEILANEPMLEGHPNYPTNNRWPDRNQMAWHYVKAGYAAFAFDNPGFNEISTLTDSEEGFTSFETTTYLSNYGMWVGYNYIGISVFQKLQFMDQFLLKQDYVDKERIGASGHSLGAWPVISLGLLREEVKAVVVNDFLCDEMSRFVSVTEGDHFYARVGFQIIPGLLQHYSEPEATAALAPKFLALNEGGAEELLEMVRHSYAVVGASDHLQIEHYPKYSDPASRKDMGPVPKYGLTEEQFMHDYSRVDEYDHSFRAEHSLRLLKKAFGK